MRGVFDPDNPWTVRLGLMVLTHVVGTMNIVSVLAMAPVISNDMGLTATQFGTFVTAYYGAQAFWSLPSGGLTDRFGVAWVVVSCHAVMAVAAVALALAPDYPTCLAAMFVMGVGYAMTNPSTSRGVLDWFPAKRRGAAMGIKQVGVPIGGVIAAGNGALAAWYDWQGIMLWVAAAIAVNGVLCLYLVRFERRGGPQERRAAMKNIGEVVRDGNVNVYVWSNGMLNFGQTNFFAFLALFLTEAARASQPMAGFAIGFAQTASAIARVLWGAASDKAFGGRRRILLIWLGVVAVVFLAAMPLTGPGWRLWVLGLGFVAVLGVTIASFAPVAQAIGVEMVEARLAGSAMGYNMVGVHIGGMLGPVAFGALVDHTGGYTAGWLATAAVVAVGVVMIAMWFKERER